MKLRFASYGRNWALVAALLVLTGCLDPRENAKTFNATGYQSEWSITGGFSSARIDNTHWRVKTASNAYTSMARAVLISKVRAAEIGRENHFTHVSFSVQEDFDCQPAPHLFGMPKPHITAAFGTTPNVGTEEISSFIATNRPRVEAQPTTSEKQAAFDDNRKACAARELSNQGIKLTTSSLPPEALNQ
jgi:hypothetical protein